MSENTNTEREALLPCPFCGKTHTLIVGAASEMWDEEEDGPFTHTETYAVFCDASTEGKKGGCGGSGGYFVTKEDAIEAWNRRASLSLPATGQEPYCWTVTGGHSMFRGQYAKQDALSEAKHCGGTAIALPLYAALQPAVAAGWIASADQMPPPGERVFWMDKDSRMVGYDTWMGEDFRWTASHWMRIPPAPSTEGESK